MNKQSFSQPFNRLLNWEIKISTKVVIVVIAILLFFSLIIGLLYASDYKNKIEESNAVSIDALAFHIHQELIKSNYLVNSTTESRLKNIVEASVFHSIEIYMGPNTYIIGTNHTNSSKQYTRKIHQFNSISDDRQTILIRAYANGIGAILKERIVEYILINLLLLIIIGSITARIINTLVSKPINFLVTNTRLITSDDTKTRFDVIRKDEYGELTEFINRMLDNIDQKQQELKFALTEAKNATAAKSVFLANMSHEIRTPLTAIIGFAETLFDETRSEQEQLTCIQTIKDNGSLLLQVINDILDLSKIEAEKFIIEHVTFSLFKFVEEINVIIKQRANEKGIQFAINYHFPLPEYLNTDPMRLKQIVLNLCSNAIKFTENGHIHINVHYESFKDIIRFEVLDTGIGLTEDQLKKIFNAFDQADSSTTRRYGGTGLGLSLSKKLAILLDGDIQVQSKIGCGSQFTASVKSGITNNLTLIYEIPDTPKHKPVNNYSSTPIVKGSILLAEDIPDNQQLMEYFIKKTHANLTIVENGKQAVEAALNNKFDLILMDMQMPIMDGLQAVETLREQNYKGTIAMVTANTMKEDRIKSLRAGCNDFLPKPINQRELYKLIQRYLPADNNEQFVPEPLYSNLLEEPEITDLVNKFVTLLPESIKLVNEKYTSQDYNELKQVIHKIKGQGGQFGYPELSKIAKEIEKHIKDSNFTGLAGAIDEINSISNRIYAGTQHKNSDQELQIKVIS